MRISRRAFLSRIAALAAAGVLPTPAIPAAIAATPAPEFGFSYDGSLFQTGFPSRAAAAATAALERPGAAYRTAEVAAYGLGYPTDLGEQAAEWLLNGGHLGNAMADWMACANEEGDFEGEFADACNAGSRLDLGNAGRASVSSALRRIGLHSVADLVIAGSEIPPALEPDEASLDALSADPVLAAELAAALAAWAESEGLERELRGLHVSAVEIHTSTDPLAQAA